MDFSHLHDKFFESYKKRYQSMIKLWQETRASQSLTGLESFKFQVHGLKGESGTLGFAELFEIATQIDNDARAIVQQGFSRELVSSIDHNLNELIAAHKQNPNPSSWRSAPGDVKASLLKILIKCKQIRRAKRAGNVLNVSYRRY